VRGINRFLTNRRYNFLSPGSERACRRNPMKLISRRDHERLLAKGRERHALINRNHSLFYASVLPVVTPTAPVFFPIVLLLSPDKSGLWLLSDIDALNHDRAYGLRYAAGSLPEIGYFSLSELEGLRGARRQRARQIRGFRPNKTLTAYASELWTNGCISPLKQPAATLRMPEASFQSSSRSEDREHRRAGYSPKIVRQSPKT